MFFLVCYYFLMYEKVFILFFGFNCMGLFRKKKKEVKENIIDERGTLDKLPPLPELPPLPDDLDIEGKASPLPSLPDSQPNDFDNEIVKAAVEDTRLEKVNSSRQARTRELSGPEISKVNIKTTREMPTRFKKVEEITPVSLPPQPNFSLPQLPAQPRIEKGLPSEEIGKKGSIFIQIDKFEDALESFSEIKRRVNEISDMLKDVKEIRDREDVEMNEWEREVETIKSRIDSLDSEIFKKLD